MSAPGFRLKWPRENGDRFVGPRGLYVDHADLALVFPTQEDAARERCGREIVEEAR